MVSLVGHRSNLGTCRIPSIQLFFRDQEGGTGEQLTDLTIKSFHTFKLSGSVGEQWARYPEVTGSIPAQAQLFDNFQKSLE